MFSQKGRLAILLTFMMIMTSVFAPLTSVSFTAFATATEMLLSQNKPVLTSDGAAVDAGRPASLHPSNVVNGITNDGNNGWDAAAGTANPWVQIDLGDVYQITKIKVYARPGQTWEGFGPLGYFEILASNDPDGFNGVLNTDYVGLASEPGYSGNYEDLVKEVTNENKYQYIRLRWTGGGNYMYVNQIEVFGLVEEEAPPPVMAEELLSQNKPVLTSDGAAVDAGRPASLHPSNVVNGITNDGNNGWDATAGTANPWVQIDLEDAYVITKYKIYQRPDKDWGWEGYGPMWNFEILASNDPNGFTGTRGTDYISLANVGAKVVDWPEDLEQTITNTNKYRYIRLRWTGGGTYIYVNQLEIFGLVEGEVVDPGTDPTDEARDIYVAPDGDDEAGTGAIGAPFATIEKARDTVRAMVKDKDITVYLRGGEYKIDDQIDFLPQDSAPDGFTITYKNYDSETPVLTGAMEVGDAWTDDGSGNGIVKTNVGTERFRELFVNGERAPRARTQSYRMTQWGDGPLGITDSANHYFAIAASVYNSGDLNGFTAEELKKIEAVPNMHWSEALARLDHITVSGNNARIFLANNASMIFTRPYPDKSTNQSVHFENAYKFIDEPGEWYLDEETGDLFYKLRAGETTSNITAVIGTVDTFINIKGTVSNRVKNLVFEGMTFEYTKYQRAIDDNLAVTSQAPGVMLPGVVISGDASLGTGRLPAALYMEGADNILVTKNTFNHLGGTGIDVKNMAIDNKIIGNVITDVSGNGIAGGLSSSTESAYFANPAYSNLRTVVENNYINGTGKNYYCGVGIVFSYSEYATIRHNDVSDTAGIGIAMGWGWTNGKTILKNTNVSYNNVYNYLNRVADGAGVYVMSRTPDSEIAYNYIHDTDRNFFASTYEVAAVYLDQGSAEYDVHENVFTRVPSLINTNEVKEGDNTFSNNESQNPEIITNSGVQPEYWELVPGVTNGTSDWTSEKLGGVRITGTITASSTASILKNGVTVWTKTVTEADSFTVNINVEPDDKISFEGNWEGVMLKPEVYVPRLTVDSVDDEWVIEGDEETPALVLNDRNKTVTIRVKADTDVTNYAPGLVAPWGAEIKYFDAAGDITDTAPTDYSKSNKVRVQMTDEAQALGYVGFDGKKKYKDLTVSVVVTSDAEFSFHKGTSIDSLIDDPDNWFTSSKVTTALNSLTFAQGGNSIYKAMAFENEMLEFNLKTSGVSGGSWPGITIRNQDPTAGDVVGAKSTCYAVIIKQDVIELQRIINGANVGLYWDNSTYELGPAISNIFFNHNGSNNRVQIGAMNVDGGVRLVMYINDKLVFDCVDKSSNAIKTPGCFGVVSQSNSVILEKFPTIKNINKAFDGESNWTASETVTEGTNALTFAANSYTIYGFDKYKDDMLEFTLNLEDIDADNGQSILIRNQSATENGTGMNSSSYAVEIKTGAIQLQRFNNGTRTLLNEYANKYLRAGENNIIHLGTVNTDGGVRLIMYANGMKVFDYVDNGAGAITGPGYFGTLQKTYGVTLSKTPVSTNLAEAIEDTANWTVNTGTLTGGTNSITFSEGGYSVYPEQTFENEMLEFYMNTDLTANAWPAVSIRNQSTADGLASGNSCYYVVFKSDVIELQRFNNGTGTGLYLTGGASEPKLGPAISNIFFEENEDNLVQFGAVNTDDGVRLVLYINGKKVFDCVDKWGGAITDPGYFGTYQAVHPIKLSSAFAQIEALSNLDLLTFEIEQDRLLLDSAPIGTEEGKYPQWAKEYFKSELDAAQTFVDANPTASDTNAGEVLAQVKAAKAIFEKSKIAGPGSLANVALNKPVTASSAPYPAEHAVDGITGSESNGWGSNNTDPNPWLQVDLQSACLITELRLYARPGGTNETYGWEGYGPRANFEILASNDPNGFGSPANYVVLAKVGNTPEVTYPNTWIKPVAPTEVYRYIRVRQTSGANFMFITEFMVFATVLPDTFSVSGSVYDDEGQPVSGADVSLYDAFDAGKTVLGTALTATDGSYMIAPEQVAGKYIIEAVSDNDSGDTTIYLPYVNVENADIVFGRIGVADKTALNSLIAGADLLIEADYTPESWTSSGFVTALSAAKAVSADPDATQTEVDTALNDLNSAKSALVLKPDAADKTALNAAVARAQQLVQSKYTAASWSIMQIALQAAESVTAKANATQEEINLALSNLESAINALVVVSTSGKTSGGGGSSKPDTNASTFIGPVMPLPLDKVAAVHEAKKAASSNGVARFKNASKITLDTMKAMVDAADGKVLKVNADSMSNAGNAVEVRVSFNPANATKDINAYGRTTSDISKARKVLFEKWFSNKIQVVSLAHKGSFGMKVSVAAKVDLAGMDTGNLYFYSYDKDTHSYIRIITDYWIDKNGYLRFSTELGGDIIISSGPLTRKQHIAE